MINNISSIQIIGTQRSGSNLLRLMLNQYSEVSAPHPPHVLRTFAPMLSNYGDLNFKENFTLLARDITDFVNANPVPWSDGVISVEDLVKRSRNTSLLGLYESLYLFKAEQDKASVWCCKSMANEYFATEIENGGIKPFYIYLYRDGRDVATSFKNAIIGPKHVYHIANKWKKDQERAQKVEQQVGRERFFSVKYEDLIRNPESILQILSSKLGLEYSSQLLEYYESAESKRTASSGEMWKNVAKPIMKDNVGKYLKELSEEEIVIFENIAGSCLIKLGYSLPGKFDETLVQSYTKEQINSFNIINSKLQDQAIEEASLHDRKVRSKQEEVLKNISNRFRS